MNGIEVKNIYKAFGEKQVINGFSCFIPHSKVTVLMGASGSGKTTLARILLGSLNADKGEINGMPQKKSAVFQEDRLINGYSIFSSIKFASPRITKEKAEKCLNSLGMSESLDTDVSVLSGGMKRRVAIARALLCDYDFLLLDEPFKGLDEDTKREVAEYIKEQTVNKTVLIITHDEEDAKAFDSKIITI